MHFYINTLSLLYSLKGVGCALMYILIACSCSAHVYYFTVLVCSSLCIVISDHLFKVLIQWSQTYSSMTMTFFESVLYCMWPVIIPYSRWFWRVFVLGYFEEVFVCQNNFLASCFLQKCVLTSTHVIKLCCFMGIYVSVPMALYQYFKLLDPCFKALRPIFRSTALSYYRP